MRTQAKTGTSSERNLWRNVYLADHDLFMPNPAPPPALATRLTRYSLAIPGRYGNDGVHGRERGYAGQPGLDIAVP